MKVTVIIPCYNAGSYLAQAVASVRDQQAGFPLTTEIIVIDDGSTDGSESICDKYANIYSRVRTVHQERRGLPVITA